MLKKGKAIHPETSFKLTPEDQKSVPNPDLYQLNNIKFSENHLESAQREDDHDDFSSVKNISVKQYSLARVLHRTLLTEDNCRNNQKHLLSFLKDHSLPSRIKYKALRDFSSRFVFYLCFKNSWEALCFAKKDFDFLKKFSSANNLGRDESIWHHFFSTKKDIEGRPILARSLLYYSVYRSASTDEITEENRDKIYQTLPPAYIEGIESFKNNRLFGLIHEHYLFCEKNLSQESGRDETLWFQFMQAASECIYFFSAISTMDDASKRYSSNIYIKYYVGGLEGTFSQLEDDRVSQEHAETLHAYCAQLKAHLFNQLLVGEGQENIAIDSQAALSYQWERDRAAGLLLAINIFEEQPTLVEKILQKSICMLMAPLDFLHGVAKQSASMLHKGGSTLSQALINKTIKSGIELTEFLIFQNYINDMSRGDRLILLSQNISIDHIAPMAEALYARYEMQISMLTPDEREMFLRYIKERVDFFLSSNILKGKDREEVIQLLLLFCYYQRAEEKGAYLRGFMTIGGLETGAYCSDLLTKPDLEITHFCGQTRLSLQTIYSPPSSPAEEIVKENKSDEMPVVRLERDETENNPYGCIKSSHWEVLKLKQELEETMEYKDRDHAAIEAIAGRPFIKDVHFAPSSLSRCRYIIENSPSPYIALTQFGLFKRTQKSVRENAEGIQELKAECRGLRDDVTVLTAQFEKSQSENRVFKVQFEKSQSENRVFKAQFEKSQSENAALRNDNKVFKAQLNWVIAKINKECIPEEPEESETEDQAHPLHSSSLSR